MSETSARRDDPQAEQLSSVPSAKEDAILAAIGDPHSRAILLRLNDGPRTVQDLLQSAGVPQSSLYRKLAELERTGLVGVQRSMLSPDGRKTDLYRSLLIEGTIHIKGDRLTLRARFRSLSSERLADLWEDLRGGGER